ncbi:DUF2304 domain-containing protein [Idiomarina seosinensis]|uniref:DUF2304 domain-containing protein n=1 Tax=Idiomarina seosinensis TaxID=281739 RepID=UPI00384C3DE8
MSNVQWVSAAIGIIISCIIFYLVRRDQLLTKDGLRWVIVAVGVLLLGLVPGIVDFFGDKLGISYPPIIVVLVALGVVLVKLLYGDIQRTRMKVDIERLVQRVGMLEAEIEKLTADTNSQSRSAQD